MIDNTDTEDTSNKNPIKEDIGLNRDSYTVPNYASIIAHLSNIREYERHYYNRSSDPQNGNYSLVHAKRGTGGDAEYGSAGDIKVDYRQLGYRNSDINYNRSANILERENIDDTPETEVTYEGGLYFQHGYDGYGHDKIIQPEGLHNVDLSKVANELINNKNFSLSISAYADTTGEREQNQELTNNRLKTAQSELISALEGEGLTKEQAAALYRERVVDNTENVHMKAHGEDNGPIRTEDNVRKQGNRVSEFNLVRHESSEALRQYLYALPANRDNESNITIASIPTKKGLIAINNGNDSRQADVNSSFDIVGGVETKLNWMEDKSQAICAENAFNIQYNTHNDLDTNNCDFRVLTDKEVTAVFLEEDNSREVTIKVDGKTFARIMLPDDIDPSRIRVGSISHEGHFQRSLVTNSEGLILGSNAETDMNQLTKTMEDLENLSIIAKNQFAGASSHEEYINDMSNTNFEEKLSETVQKLGDLLNIDLDNYAEALKTQYLNVDSPHLFQPDLLLDIDQIAHQIVDDNQLLDSQDETFNGDYLSALQNRYDNLHNEDMKVAKNEPKEQPENSVTVSLGLR